MNRKTFLHVAYITAGGGGAETYVRQIARSLSELGQRATVIYVWEPDRSVPNPSQDGAVYVEHAATSNLHWYYHRASRVLPASVARLLPDAALVKTNESTWAIRQALFRVTSRLGPIDLIELPEEMGLPLIFRGLPPYSVKLHSSDATWRYFCGEGLRPLDRQRIRLETALLRRASLVSSPSAALADYVAETCKYPRSHIPVLPYPLDVARFSPAAPPESGANVQGGSASSDDLGLSVTFVGRLVRRKGVEILARAAEAILTANPDSTIDFIGGESQEVSAASLLDLVPPALHQRVVFHGRVPNAELPEYYRRAAVVVVPSCWDNSPNTVYEAMGCGTPVVGSRAGGIPELIDDGRTGLLVPPQDPAALAASVCELLGDPAGRERMGREARARAVSQFAPEKIAKQTLELYRDALSSSRYAVT